MSDTYLGVLYLCSCCHTRLSECACPCDSMMCRNRIARPVDREMYEVIREQGERLRREVEAIDGFVKVVDGRFVPLDD